MHVDYDRFIVCRHIRLHLDLKQWRQQPNLDHIYSWTKNSPILYWKILAFLLFWGEKDLIADEKIYHIYPKNVKSMKISSSVFIYYFANKISKPFLYNDYEMIETKPIWNTLKTPSSEWSLRVSGSAELVKSINQYFYSKFFSSSFTSHRFLSSLQNIKLSLSLSFPECYLTSFLYQSGLSFFMKKLKLFSMKKII